MFWRGVPFPIFPDGLDEAIRSLSSIHISTDTDPWVIGAAFCSALAPAGVALGTVIYNAWSANKQLKKQAEQFERTICAQREASKEQFNAQVLSANRQAWINELRNVISEFVSLSSVFASTEIKLKIIQLKTPNGEKINNNKVGDIFLKLHDGAVSQRQKLKALQCKIGFLLNPSECEPSNIIEFSNKIFSLCESASQCDEIGELERFFGELNSLINEVEKSTKIVLKSEWERVKAGT